MMGEKLKCLFCGKEKNWITEWSMQFPRFHKIFTVCPVCGSTRTFQDDGNKIAYELAKEAKSKLRVLEVESKGVG